MKKRSLFGGLLLAGVLSVGSLSTAFAGAQVGAPYVAEGQSAEPGVAAGSGAAGSGAAGFTQKELPAEQEAVRDVLQAAMEKTNEADSYHISGTMNMEMTVEGQQISMQMPMDIQYAGLTSENPRFLMTANMNMGSLSVPMTFFYTDGYYYMETAGQKQKMAMDLAAAIEQSKGMTGINVSNSTAPMSDFNMVEKDGVRTIYYTYDASALNALIQTAVGAQMDMMKTLGMDMNMEVTKCVGEASINADGYLVNERMSMDFSMNMSYEGQAQNMAYHIYVGMDYLNPGQAAEFTLPSTEGFTDLSAQLPTNAALYQAQ